MPELGPLGSVRGAVSNDRPYRERHTSDCSLNISIGWPECLLLALLDVSLRCSTSSAIWGMSCQALRVDLLPSLQLCGVPHPPEG